jgi:hypothetical protein
MQRRLDLMASLVTALLVAACIVLYAASEPISAKEVLLSSLPAWLQGLGTVGAAYFGWKAFAAWRRQDADRRKAEAAEDVLRLVHAVARVVRGARFTGEFERKDTQALVYDLMFFSGEERQRARRELAAPANELQSHIPVAKHLFGKKVSDKLGSLVVMQRELEESFKEAEFLRLHSKDVGSEAWRENVMGILGVLGFRYEEKPDTFSKHLSDCVNAIEEELGPYITGEY